MQETYAISALEPSLPQTLVQQDMTHASYQKGGHGAEIDFSIGKCSVGLVVVASTQHGLCLVGLGNNEENLRKELSIEFPKALIKRRDMKLEYYLNVIRDLIDLGTAHTNLLPLDIEATSFQWLIWETLQKIPRGNTMTYGDIAGNIGQPKAARAVGRACATNSIAIVIPCHRAVGSNGSLTGYRWGMEWKKALLDLEGHRKILNNYF